MLEVVQKIFDQNIELLSQADKAIIYLREEEYETALSIVGEMADKINYIADAIIQNKQYFELVSTESIMEMLGGILEAKKNKDYVLLADLFELQLVNFICSVQQLIMMKEDILAYNELEYIRSISLLQQKIMKSVSDLSWEEENKRNDYVNKLTNLLEEELNPAYLLEQGYCVEFTSSGMMTLGAKDELGIKYYMHTNDKVWKEAFYLARKWYLKDTKAYIIYGHGLGYHIKELMDLSPEADIEIYESDMNILKLSCAFSRVTALLENPKVKLFYDPDYAKLSKRIQELDEMTKVCIHYPSLRNIKDSEAKEMLMDFIPWSRRVEEC